MKTRCPAVTTTIHSYIFQRHNGNKKSHAGLQELLAGELQEYYHNGRGVQLGIRVRYNNVLAENTGRQMKEE